MAKKKKKEKQAQAQTPKPPFIPTPMFPIAEGVDDFYRMQFDEYIQKRKDECEGLDICHKCGGVLWDLGSHGLKKCGDCGTVSGNVEGEDCNEL